MEEFIKMFEELAIEHNKTASFLDFIIRKLIEKDIISTDELKMFLKETEYFDVENDVPNEIDMMEKMNKEISRGKNEMAENINSIFNKE